MWAGISPIGIAIYLVHLLSPPGWCSMFFKTLNMNTKFCIWISTADKVNIFLIHSNRKCSFHLTFVSVQKNERIHNNIYDFNTLFLAGNSNLQTQCVLCKINKTFIDISKNISAAFICIRQLKWWWWFMKKVHK